MTPWRSLVLALCVSVFLRGGELRVATFRSDATPELREPNIWITPVVRIEDPLWAKGIVLEDGRARYVLATLDWCGLGGSTHLLFREKIAKAAGTEVSRVMVQTVHQHTAPYIDGDAYALLAKLPAPPPMMSGGCLERVTDRLAAAVKKAAANMRAFDAVGVSQAVVRQVASARRVYRDGKLVSRFSTAGKDPSLAAIPEGEIDPVLRTVTLAGGKRPLARLHFYATHPQTFCCDGVVTADFVGAAREKLETEEGVFQLYFTGCSGDVTVGKYNDTSAAARRALAGRLESALRASPAAVKFAPAEKLVWRHVPLALEKKPAAPLEGLTGQDAYRAAIGAAFAARTRLLDTAALELGRATLLFLPGEPVLEYQRYLQQAAGGRFVAAAGYGDISPGYLVTDRNYTEGGYEPSASFVLEGTEARVKQAIRKLLGIEAQ